MTVVESVGTQHIGSHGLIVAFSHEGLDALAFVLLAGSIQLGIEGEALDVVEEALLEVGRRHIVGCIDEGEHILEHTAGSSAGGHELHDAMTAGFVFVPALLVHPALFHVGGYNAVAHTGGGIKTKEGEACAEFAHLHVYLLWGDTFQSDLF